MNKGCIHCMGNPKTCIRCIEKGNCRPLEYVFVGILLMIVIILAMNYLGKTYS